MLERAMDMFAAEIGLDPAEVRRRNFIPTDAFPVTTASGRHYDIGDYAACARPRAGGRRLRRSCAPTRRTPAGAARSRQLGSASAPTSRSPTGSTRPSSAPSRSPPTGEAIVKTGSFSQGQGHETTFAQIVADQHGLPIEKITVVKGDTDAVARGTGTYGSKSTQIGGAAARQASEEVVQRAKQLAAEQLEASPDDMVLDVDTGRFHVAGAPEPDAGLARPGLPAGRAGAAGRAQRGGRLHRRRSPRSRSGRTLPSSRSTPRPAR